MKAKLCIGALVALNLILAIGLVAALSSPEPNPPNVPSDRSAEAVAVLAQVTSSAPLAPALAPKAHVADTPFARMYSEDPKEFAANLRAIRCPEATVRDIIAAEIARKFRAQEEALRPKPADHVPVGWSSATSEAKLLERRVQAAALAHEKAAQMKDALGYSVPVSLPLYALTATDQKLQAEWAQFPDPKRVLLNQVQEDYWVKAQALQEQTRGFWESQDYIELKRLKTEWQEQIRRVLEAQ